MARVNRSTGFFLVLGVAALLATVTGVRMIGGDGDEQPRAETPATEPNVYCSGNVDVPSGLTVLIPNIQGKIKSISVKEGDTVKAGQVLVQLDDESVRETMKVAEQGLKVAKARLEEAKQAVARAQILHETKITEQLATVSRAEGLYNDAEIQLEELRRKNQGEVPLVQKADIRRAENALVKAKEQRDLAKLGLAQLKSIDPKQSLREPEETLKEAELKVRAAAKELERYVITAPADGQILELNYQVGGPCPLPIGHPNAGRAMMFRPAEDFIVRAEVDQENAMLVKPGMKATLTFRGTNFEYKYTGVVEKVSDYIQRRRTHVVEVDQFNSSLVCECIIRIDPGSKYPIKHNMRMGVQIHTGN